MPMTLHAWHRLARRLSGGLLAALLLATLAPAVSRGLAAGADRAGDPQATAHWVELCTSQGMQRVWAGAPPAQPDADPAHLDRCALCLLQAERFAPLLPGQPALPVVAGHWQTPSRVPEAAADVPRLTAQARGPPLLG